VRLTFAYDGAGRLSTVTDVDGKVTTIQRNGSGIATAIIAPGGQQTALVVGADGLLTALTDPANQTTSFTYAVDGLLASLTDPRGGVHKPQERGQVLTWSIDAPTLPRHGAAVTTPLCRWGVPHHRPGH
jgi:YD repeat-containing protein